MIIVGVDAGASKTEAVAFNLNGKRLSQALTGQGNMVVQREEALLNITNAVRGVLPGSFSPEDVFVCVGAAGADTGDNRAALQAHLKDAFNGCGVRVINDGHIALYAAHGTGDGIVIIAGTGSIAMSRHAGRFRRVGGWGQLLADLGSGYDIVRSAFLHLIAQYETDIPYDALSLALVGRLNTDVYGAVDFFHTALKGDIAALLPVVINSARQGDAQAKWLLTKAGADLADMVLRIDKASGFTDEVNIGCVGSLLNLVPEVKDAFGDNLSARNTRLKILPEPVYAPLGAIGVYLEEKNAAGI